MKTMMIKCDNPRCDSIKAPEWVSQSGRSHRPPYGWLHLKGGFFGPGPSMSIEVCSAACATPAITAKLHDFYEDRDA